MPNTLLLNPIIPFPPGLSYGQPEHKCKPKRVDICFNLVPTGDLLTGSNNQFLNYESGIGSTPNTFDLNGLGLNNK